MASCGICKTSEKLFTWYVPDPYTGRRLQLLLRCADHAPSEKNDGSNYVWYYDDDGLPFCDSYDSMRDDYPLRLSSKESLDMHLTPTFTHKKRLENITCYDCRQGFEQDADEDGRVKCYTTYRSDVEILVTPNRDQWEVHFHERCAVDRYNQNTHTAVKSELLQKFLEILS
jgi:hypothetical protein